MKTMIPLAALLFTLCTQADPPPLQVEIEMEDGSFYRGALLSELLTLRTSYGMVPIPLIRSRALTADGNTVRVTMNNGDQLSGVSTPNVLNLKTQVGPLSVPLNLVKRASPVPPIRLNEDGAYWKVNYDGVHTWHYRELPSGLKVTEIEPTVMHSGGGQKSARVLLSRPVDLEGDFTCSAGISWDADNRNQTMHQVYLRLLDSEGNAVATLGYVDNWIGHRGGPIARAGTTILSQKNGGPYAGRADLSVNRHKDTLRLLWDDKVLAETQTDVTIASMGWVFSYYGSRHAGSTTSFGTLAISNFSVQENN